MSWGSTMSRNERLTAYFSLFNGLALFEVPEEVAERVLSNSGVQQSEDSDTITCFLKFVYHQLRCPADFSTCIQTHFSKLDGVNCPDVVTLYLFVDSIARFFSKGNDRVALDRARRYYGRLPSDIRILRLGNGLSQLQIPLCISSCSPN